MLDAFTRGEACCGAGRLEVLSLAVVDDSACSAAAAEFTAAGGAGGAPAQEELEAARRQPAAAAAAAAPPPARAAPPVARRADAAAGSAPPPADMVVICARGPVAALPEAHAARRERFAELEALQPGWQVELRSRGGAATVDAVFFAPAGGPECKSFADARRAALKARTQGNA